MSRTASGKIGVLGLTAATYFAVFGGPFGLEDIVSKAGYLGAILILLITPLLWAFPTTLMVSELSSALPEEGGYYVWAKRALGPFWGFQEAWLSLAGSIFDMAIYPTLFVSYLSRFAPHATAGSRGILIGAGLIALAALWNMRGAAFVGGSSVWMGILLVAPFAALAVVALFHRAPETHPMPLRDVDFLGGILVAMWNFMGWDNVSTVANDVDRPQRTYPLAMALSVTAVALSAVLPIAAVGATGIDANSWSTGGWADVARLVLPGAQGLFLAFSITLAGIIAAFGTQNALTLTLARLPVVLAEDGYLPRFFTGRLSGSKAPWVSIIVCSCVWGLGLGLSFVKLIMLDVLLTGLSVLLEFASLIGLRIREPQLHRPYRVPGGLPAAILLAVPPLALLMLTVIRNKVEPIGPMNALELGGILIVLGWVLYWLAHRLQLVDQAGDITGAEPVIDVDDGNV